MTAARFILEFLCWMVVLRMANFLWVYWRVVMPLRAAISQEDILAPPVRTTFLYHVCVVVIVICVALATLWNMWHHRPHNPFVLPIIPAMAVLYFTVESFRHSYTGRLARAHARKK